MSVGDLLGRLVDKLNDAGVPHMVAGSFASTYHGVPRSTQDVDVVIDPSASALETFVSSLPQSKYYVDAGVARDAFHRRSRFSVIDMTTGWKVDLIIRKDRPFSIEELSRRQRATIFGAEVFVVTAEDSILSKLEWAKLTDSERQLRDVAGILSVHGASLDRAYLERWVAGLGVEAQWARVSGALP